MMHSRLSQQQAGLIHQNPSVSPDEFLRNNPNSGELGRMVKSLSEYKLFLENLCEKLSIQLTEYQKELGHQIKLPDDGFIQDDNKPPELQFTPIQNLIQCYELTNKELSKQLTEKQQELQAMEQKLADTMRDNQEICQLELKNNKFLQFISESDFQSRMEQSDREQMLRVLEEENAQLMEKFNSFEAEQRSSKKQVEDTKQQYNTLNETNKQLEQAHNKLIAQYETLNNQYQQLKIQRQQDIEEKAFAENNSEKLEQSAKSMEKQMNHMKVVSQRKEQQLQDALNDKNNELTSLEYEFEKLKENYDDVARTVNLLENQMQKAEIEKKNNLEQISKFEYDNMDYEKKQENLEYQLKQCQNQKEITEQSYKELRDQYDQISQEKDQIDMTLKNYELDLQNFNVKQQDVIDSLKDQYENDYENLKQDYQEQVSKLEDKINQLEQNENEQANKVLILEREKKILDDQLNSLQNSVLETYIERIKILENRIDENQYQYQQESERKLELSEETLRLYKEKNEQLEAINGNYKENLDNLLTEKNIISKKLERALEDKQNMISKFEQIKFKVKGKLGNNNDIYD